MNILKNYLAVVLVAVLMSACGGGGTKEQAASKEVAEAPAAESATAVPDSVALVIEGTDNMKFNKDELKVTEGQVVTLTLKHVGSMPKGSMGHNWVLLAAKADPAVFGAAATSAPDTDYIPQDKLDWVIAHTPVIGGGEEATITFEAPAAGYYKFICSFPGHWGVMQGDFVVQPK
ncbi:azurin [Marinoscillum furvescens]|uniref:Azurin n=1 Tax=Marinoscillum furvescens DSM 4134 TaxID=1122208 RepID=A0A3D9L5T9_MARFU|nr:azurin [Marinoscillum furvescens]REE00076.1 azurin [Marinoscillum furvescens DSM 4134]